MGNNDTICYNFIIFLAIGGLRLKVYQLSSMKTITFIYWLHGNHVSKIWMFDKYINRHIYNVFFLVIYLKLKCNFYNLLLIRYPS